MSVSLYQGSCLCNGVQFNVQGSPEKVLVCYCSDCAKNAGAPYQISAKFPKTQVRINQGEDLLCTWNVMGTASGSVKYKVFCKRCGCTLWTIPTAHGGEHYIVRTSLLDGGLENFKPQFEFFSKMRPEYLKPFEGTKQFDTMPGK